MGVTVAGEARVRFPSMPNFRQVYVGSDFNNIRPLKLFRSSRPDLLTEQEVALYHSTGFASIIDCRSAKEYKKANGAKLLDQSYSLFKVKSPVGKFKPGEEVKYVALQQVNKDTSSNKKSSKPAEEMKPLLSAEESELEDNSIIKNDVESNLELSDLKRNHFLIDFFKMNYIWTVFNRAPWYIKLYSLFILCIDIVLNTGFNYFVRVFAKNVLNKKGLIGQYKDIINHSQGPICSALKLMLDPSNVPAMLNCAHGKDRTGLVTAMVLVCFGESKERISLDYAQSEAELLPMKERLYEEVVKKFHMCESFLTARAETMMELLTSIENEYGSLTNYLEALGFNKDDQAALRKNLSQ